MNGRTIAIVLALGLVAGTLGTASAAAEQLADDAPDLGPASTDENCEGPFECILYVCNAAGRAVEELTGNGWRCI